MSGHRHNLHAGVNLQQKENYFFILVEYEGKSINFFATETVIISLKTLLLYRQTYTDYFQVYACFDMFSTSRGQLFSMKCSTSDSCLEGLGITTAKGVCC